MLFKTWWHKPKNWDKKEETIETTDCIRHSLIITRDELKNKELRVPNRCKFNPHELQKLLLEDKNAYILITFLMCGLQDSSKCDKNLNITVSQQELATFSGLSLRTVNSAIVYLETNKYLIRTNKQSYKISPLIAFYGNETDWAIEIFNFRGNCYDKSRETNTIYPSTIPSG